jgi:ribonuclease PH
MLRMCGRILIAMWMNDGGGLIEVQGTAEAGSFTRSQLDGILTVAEKGIRELFLLQRQK